MAQQTINVGTSPDSGTGEGLRTAFIKVNDNFTELYNADTATTAALALKADLASPTFTGTPSAPTAATATNTTQLATTAFVQNNKVSPAFTGTPTAPTATFGTNTTQLATTAFVQASAATKQPLDATLTAFAGLTIAANSLTIGTGLDAFNQTSFGINTFPARASTGALEAKTITDFGLSILDDVDASAVRTTIGAVGLTGDESIAGIKTFTSAPKSPGDLYAVSDLGNVTGATNFDVSAGGTFYATVTGNWQPTFTNQPGTGYSKRIILRITNGGAFTITWPSVNWTGGAAPTLDATGTDLIEFFFYEGTIVDGHFIGNVA